MLKSFHLWLEDGRHGKIVSNTHTFSSKSVKKKNNLLVIKIICFFLFSSTSIAGKLKYRKFNNFF